MRGPVVAASVVLVGLVSGCGSDDGHARPADLGVVLQYRSGSVPPPYHEEYRVEIGPEGRGRIALTPDYPESRQVPVFRVAFRVGDRGLDALWDRVRQGGVLEDDGGRASETGGARADLTVIADGKTHAVSDREGEPLLAVVRPAVPARVRAVLEARRARYAERRYRKRPSPRAPCPSR